jgi:hypothetical protein
MQKCVINPTISNLVTGGSTRADATTVRRTAQEGLYGQFAFFRCDLIDLCPIVVAVREP